MKILISLTIVIGLLVFPLACLKDEITTETKQEGAKYYSVDDFDQSDTRDGGRNPFHFITSQVEYDPFTRGEPQTAINIQRLDSTTYIRTSAPNAGAWGTSFDIYDIKYFFKDGQAKVSNGVYAESSIGNSYTYLPNPDFNQLFVNSPLNYVTLKRGTRSEIYVDAICGRVKKRFPYIHYFNSDSVGVSTIVGDRCTSNVFSYQLITRDK